LALAIVILAVALGIQTWRLSGAQKIVTTSTPPGSSGPPPSSVTPTSTPGTTRPPNASPPGQPEIPGLACLADLIGKPQSVRIPKSSLAAQLDAIATWDENERELQFNQIPEPTIVDPAALAERVTRDAQENYPPELAALDSRYLAALGAVPSGYDLRGSLTSLLSEQVAGFYDPYTKQLVVGSPDGRDALDTLGSVTLAHELEHALADQALGLPSLEVEPNAAGVDDTDKVLGRRSLVEGDASLITNRFILSALSASEQRDMLNNPAVNGSSGAIASVPNYLRSELTFPYESGLNFACALKQAGGWDLVDSAYSEPPTTSAQILFPDRFANREGAADPPDPGSLTGPWVRNRAQTLGAAELLWLFRAPGDNPGAALPDPLAAAANWGGGEVMQWSAGEQTALGISLAQYTPSGGGTSPLAARNPARIQQTPTAGPQLCDAVRDWYSAAFPQSRDGGATGDEVRAWDGDRQDAVLRCVNGNVRLGIGPDLGAARALTA
jgi:hypothetical protein